MKKLKQVPFAGLKSAERLNGAYDQSCLELEAGDRIRLSRLNIFKMDWKQVEEEETFDSFHDFENNKVLRYTCPFEAPDEVKTLLNKIELANDYLKKYDTETAINRLIAFQISKATTSGFLTGFGGFITMPVTLPANITSIILIQLRMIAAIACIQGYDLKDDEVQTFVYATLAGTSVSEIAKKAGIVIGNKLAVGAIQKVPGKVLVKINQAVGFRLLTKFGSKGAINLGKMVPVAGAMIGGGFDGITTKIIAKQAQKTFSAEGLRYEDEVEDTLDVL